MKKLFLVSSVLVAGIIMSYNVNASVELSGLSNMKNKVKLSKEDYQHRTDKVAKKDSEKKDSASEKFMKKLEKQEDLKKSHSRLPIYSKYRTDKHHYEELCVKGSNHILINKKRARHYCKQLHSS